ncbi:MAG: hypothetical protein ACXW2A_09695 [Burkholderiales bacterium]
MKRSSKFAVGIATSLTLGLAAAAYAHPGPTGGGPGPHAKAGMHHAMKGGMGPGATGHGPGQRGAASQLMTPEERTALREKMRSATPEERQQIAQATHTEMQKRAKAKGVTLPEQRGPRSGAGPRSGRPSQAPAATENAH